MCVFDLFFIVLLRIGSSFLGPRLGLLVVWDVRPSPLLAQFQLPKGSVVYGIAEAGDTEPERFLIPCDAGVAGATVVEISGGLGVIWVQENLVKSCHVSQPFKQFRLPPEVRADSVLAFTLAQSVIVKDQRPDIRLPLSAAENLAEQSRLEAPSTSFATEVRGTTDQQEAILNLLKTIVRDFKEDVSDVDDEGSAVDEDSVAEGHTSHFPLLNPGEARSSKEAAASKQKTDPLLAGLKCLLTGPQAALAATSEALHAAILLQILKELSKSQRSSRKLVKIFGVMRGLWRCDAASPRIIWLALEGDLEHSFAFACQISMAFHQVVLETPDWSNALQRIPAEDILREARLGSEELGMEMILSYVEALRGILIRLRGTPGREKRVSKRGQTAAPIHQTSKRNRWLGQQSRKHVQENGMFSLYWFPISGGGAKSLQWAYPFHLHVCRSSRYWFPITGGGAKLLQRAYPF